MAVSRVLAMLFEVMESEVRGLAVERIEVRSRDVMLSPLVGWKVVGRGVKISSAVMSSVSSLWTSRSTADGSSGAATGLPLTPQASTGNTIVCRLCTVSFGHIRFAFLTTFAEQLYLIVIPANVSSFFT